MFRLFDDDVYSVLTLTKPNGPTAASHTALKQALKQALKSVI